MTKAATATRAATASGGRHFFLRGTGTTTATTTTTTTAISTTTTRSTTAEDDDAGRAAAAASGESSKRKGGKKAAAAARGDAKQGKGNGKSNLGPKPDRTKVSKNKQRVLILSSRGTTQRFRHLLNDLHALMPHSKRESKLDTKTKLSVLNELAADIQCNNCIFFDVRKNQDLYMWMSRTPSGPSVKFLVQGVHTMDELRMTGNCLKGSRPILSFDQHFDDGNRPHLPLLRELFCQVFGTPRTSRKIKPFIDHVLTFSVVGEQIFFRNYQAIEKEGQMALVEIGPRFNLTIMRIFSGSFLGATLYENPKFVSPNLVRREQRLAEQLKYFNRVKATMERDQRAVPLPQDELSDVFR
ncbi:ribosome biogenesis protein BRX1 [Zopfochytrium polystomum]|nr:ribosome biogenesis protein BRX1 [Zopfochytrium polystomum]